MQEASSDMIKKIGIRIPSWYPGRNAIIRGILYFLRKNEVSWQLEIPRKSDGELPELKIDDSWEGDGIISFRYTEDEIKSFQERGINLVNISSVLAPNVTTIKPDNVQAGEVAARHLSDLGLKRVIFIGRSNRDYSSDRWTGLKGECDKKGIEHALYEFDVNALPQHERAAFLKEKLSGMLPELEYPIGVLASDDLMAGNVISICKQLEIEIPKQVAIVGFGNNPLFCLTHLPSLTSVDIPSTSIGYKAAEAMNALINGKTYPAMTEIPVEQFKMRTSTNTLAYHDPRTKAAIEYIRAEAPRRLLKVQDVCKAANLSQSSLKVIMAKTLGRSPKKEIDIVRANTFREYLINTDKSIGEIAYAMGFTASEDASRFFRKMMQMTPTEYRKQHK